MVSQVPRSVASGRYEIQHRLGAGSFGAVYRGLDVQTRASVAVKFEDGRTQQLQKELAVLRTLQGEGEHCVQGFAKILYFGRKGGSFCLVMECLGKSLEERLKNCGGKLSIKTTVLVAQQMLACIETLHSKGVVHRDIKPDNFMCGVAERRHHLYLIDFGLAEWYWKDGAHVSMKKEDEFKGTMRYASASSQRYFTQSRRDDLEAAGHTLLYFLRGSLPWSGLQAETKAEQFQKVREMKETTAKSTLYSGLPEPFEKYATYCGNLGYKDRPNYQMIYKLFSDLRAQLQQHHGRIEDSDFEWEGRSESRPMVPLREHVPVMMPDDMPAAAPIRRPVCPPTSVAAAQGSARSALAAAQVPQRLCPICHGQVNWTTREAPGAGPWQCDMSSCRNGRAQAGLGRWYCQKCSNDYCIQCMGSAPMQAPAPKNMVPVGSTGSRASSGSMSELLAGFLGCGKKAATEPEARFSAPRAGYRMPVC